MKTLNLTVLICILILLYSCKDCSKSKIVYTKLETTTFNCFCDSLVYKTNKPVVCEPSAAVFYNNTLFLANDKNIPNSSSLFKVELDKVMKISSLELFKDTVLEKGRKYEDFTITPNSQLVFLSTGFDRIKQENNEWDCYNNLYYWNTNSVIQPKLLTQNNDTSIKSSKYLREIFANVIDTLNYKNGVPYFKIEGIAAIPGDTLLFAVREYGNSYKDFKYCMKIIAMPYKIEDENVILSENATLLFDYNTNDYKEFEIEKSIGISSIEYNKFDNNLYMLTSYELGNKSEEVGAYLWTVKLDDIRKNSIPTLVYGNDNKPLHFKHKAEGITVINDSTLLVIHDDDRIYGPSEITDSTNQFKRKHNQAAYTILYRTK